MGDDPVGDGMHARIEGGVRRRGRNAGREASLKEHSLGGEMIYRRAGRAMIAVAAQMIGAKGIDIDEDDVHTLL